jgi:hypothetical protein
MAVGLRAELRMLRRLRAGGLKRRGVGELEKVQFVRNREGSRIFPGRRLVSLFVSLPFSSPPRLGRSGAALSACARVCQPEPACANGTGGWWCPPRTGSGRERETHVAPTENIFLSTLKLFNSCTRGKKS